MYGVSKNPGIKLTRAYKARTLVTQANNPSVNMFRGKSNTLRSGTRIKLIIVKAKAPMISVLNTPPYDNPGRIWVVAHKETIFTK